MSRPPRFLEFFAGGGLARIGLGDSWRCVFANDWCPRKAAAYTANFADAASVLHVGDVAHVRPADLPDSELAWASFPCQDLSLAGLRAGLKGRRSGVFAPFWRLIAARARMGRPVPLVVLENVAGVLTSGGGRDFPRLMRALAEDGYRAGAVVADAAEFLPQSRPRLFVIAVHDSVEIPDALVLDEPPLPWAPPSLLQAAGRCPARSWIWWNLPPAPGRQVALRDVVECDGEHLNWDPPERTERLLAMMSPTNRRKVAERRTTGSVEVGALFRRTRRDREGASVQRAEVRFDGLCGCLRTPAGGSSRQALLFVEGDAVRSRLLSPREAARVMGLPDGYQLPERRNDAYQVFGDGVAVPVVSWLAEHLLNPLAASARSSRSRAVA